MVLGILAAAFGLAFLLTPAAGWLARRLNILDHPDAKLKKHGRPIPYLGGLAVYLSFILAVVGFKLWQTGSVVGVVGVLSGASLIVVLGLLDDKYKLTPAVKFAGQAVAALLLVACHMRLQFIPNPWISMLLTIVWLVGVTNAMNLIDIMDGLCSGVAVIAGSVFLAVALQNGRYNDAYLAAGLTGAALGFLPHNFPKARIYLGDTGALLLGFVLASIAIGEGYSQVNPLAVLAPILILGVPIFDTLFIMFIRHRKGVSMFQGSPDHVALRLVKLGNTKTRTVLLLWLASLALGALALVSTHWTFGWALLAYLTAGIGALFAAERLGSFPMELER